MVLTPIDTLKTTQQTKGGKEGLRLLRERIKEHGVGCLWYGALATAAATFVGNCKHDRFIARNISDVLHRSMVWSESGWKTIVLDKADVGSDVQLSSRYITAFS